MNLLEQINQDFIKERVSHLESEAERLITKTPVRQCDDRLQNVIPRKTANDRLISAIAPDYIDVLRNDPSHNATVSRYQHNETGAYFNRWQLTKAQIESGAYKPVFKHTVSSGDAHIIADDGCVYINQGNLAYNQESRLNLNVKTVLNSNVFRIKHRQEQPTKKQEYNAARNILKRNAKPHEYEWDLNFDADLSAFLWPICKRIAKEAGRTIIDGTAYIFQNKSVTFKFYNTTAAQAERKLQPYKHLKGDVCKLEITIETEYFKNHKDLRNISVFKKQTDCHLAIKKHVCRLLDCHFLGYLKPSEKRQLYKLAKVSGHDDFMRMLQDEKTLETSVYSEFQDIKKQISYLHSLLEKNTAALNSNTNALSSHEEALAKNTAAVEALTASLSTAETSRIDERKKPKLRVIK